MALFAGTADALKFVASNIEREAQAEGVSLSEVERKMLYFSETGSTLPKMMETAAAFERDYDDAQYEEKIVSFIENLLKRLQKEKSAELGIWHEAVRVLKREDHYILVMIDQASMKVRPRYDRLKLWGTGLAICLWVLSLTYLLQRLDLGLTKESAVFFLWSMIAGLTVAYLLFWVVVGKERAIDFTSRGADRIAGLFHGKRGGRE